MDRFWHLYVATIATVAVVFSVATLGLWLTALGVATFVVALAIMEGQRQK